VVFIKFCASRRYLLRSLPRKRGRMKKLIVVAALLSTLTVAGTAQSIAGCKLSANKYDLNSTSNQYSRCGSPYSPDSINNPYGKYGSPYSPYSVTNQYATEAPRITANDGTYLGRYSANAYAPDSSSNRYGLNGSPFAFNSINNEYGEYGSLYSPQSPTNPYTTRAPTLSDGGDED